MDGVLWRGNTPIVDLAPVFQIIREHKINYAFATNNSTKTPAMYKQRLNNLSVPVEEKQILTSATTSANLLKEKNPNGGPVYILGEKGLKEALHEKNFFHQEENVLAVVGGLDTKLTYEKMKRVTLLLQKEVDFYYTNSDTTFPSPDGKIPGAGSILKMLEVASGREAILAGKPLPKMFENALEVLGTQPENTLVIGDRIETDILGGIRANCLTALVLSGITLRSELTNFTYKPDLIFDDLSELVNQLSAQNWEI